MKLHTFNDESTMCVFPSNTTRIAVTTPIHPRKSVTKLELFGFPSLHHHAWESFELCLVHFRLVQKVHAFAKHNPNILPPNGEDIRNKFNNELTSNTNSITGEVCSDSISSQLDSGDR